jgi:hypothetical protein
VTSLCCVTRYTYADSCEIQQSLLWCRLISAYSKLTSARLLTYKWLLNNGTLLLLLLLVVVVVVVVVVVALKCSVARLEIPKVLPFFYAPHLLMCAHTVRSKSFRTDFFLKLKTHVEDT